MIRRALPVAVAAVSLALLPSVASATPDHARVDSWQSQSYFALVEGAVLPDGLHATAYLNEGRGTNQREGWASLQLDVWSTYDCGDQTCAAHSYGFVQLTDEQVDIDRALRTASVHDVSVELTDPSYEPDPWTGEEPDPWTGEDPYAGGEDPWVIDDPSVVVEEPVADGDPYTGGEEPWTGEDPGDGTGDEEGQPEHDSTVPAPSAPRTVTVSLEFTGTGPVDRSADHYSICGDGERECQSIRVDATREARAVLTLDGDEAASTTGRLFFGHSVDAAAPKIVLEGD